MADDRKGSSFTGKYDLEGKTARPTSVGPHDVTRDQEDPDNPGIDPGTGYAQEIAELNRAKHHGDRPASGPAPAAKSTETADESGGTAKD